VWTDLCSGASRATMASADGLQAVQEPARPRTKRVIEHNLHVRNRTHIRTKCPSKRYEVAAAASARTKRSRRKTIFRLGPRLALSVTLATGSWFEGRYPLRSSGTDESKAIMPSPRCRVVEGPLVGRTADAPQIGLRRSVRGASQPDGRSRRRHNDDTGHHGCWLHSCQGFCSSGEA
jgi:hypothetical protein